MAQSNALAYGLLLAFALTTTTVAAADGFFINYDQPPLAVNTTQVYIALCTGDDSYQPWHEQADYCTSIPSGSFPRSNDLINGKGFLASSGWSVYFAPGLSPAASGGSSPPYFSFQTPAGLPAPELLAGVISGYSKYTVVVAEAFVQPNYELKPVSLWVFYNSQVSSVNYNGGSSGYGDTLPMTYDKFSFTAFRADSKGNTKAYKTFCYDFEKSKQC